MRPVERQARKRRARGDQLVALRGDAGTRLGGQRGDGLADAAERDDLADPVDRQPERGEADPAAGEPLAIALAAEARRGEVDARERRQSPASSADIATAATACAVVSTAAVAT